MPASNAFWGNRWDNSKFLKISAVLLTSAVVFERRCLPDKALTRNMNLELMLSKCLCKVYMKDYYNLFVELSLQQCTKNDYGNKLKVKKHNAAYKKLNKLQDEMMKNIGDDALHALLNHEDDRVKVNAASFCLNSEVLVEQSILTLEKIIAGSDDPTICFSAKMLLQKYR